MIPIKHEYAIAFLTYKIYEYILLPIGTLLLGLSGFGFTWSFIASLPIILKTYSDERKTLAYENRPEHKAITLAIVSLAVNFIIFLIYCTGYAIRYFMI